MRYLKVDLDRKVKTLQKNIYFEGLGADALKTIAGYMRLHEVERGETLFLEGDPCAGLHIVQSGGVKLYRLSPQGRQYIVNVLEEGATFNEVSVFGRGANPVNAAALTNSTVWVIEVKILRDLISDYPEYAQKIINNFAENLRKLVNRVSEMAFFQVTHRLARLISRLSEEELNGVSNMRLTQDQIAARLGTVREVVARSLRELERNGAIRVENRRIHVVDKDVLAQITQGKWN
ncbi:MAG: hypothetical protein B6I38_02265 [Anaerolineaceae bacterium 4572_5.1]|nr:MAG: hypothetical protein B6I38_02265 [Anaerolineaceae bacterium 4572_5.1]